MNHDELADSIDFAILDAQSKASFAIIDQKKKFSSWLNKQKREYKKLIEEIEILRTQNPALFDQLVVIGLAALIEIIASYLKRRN